jgi:uroporphyrinogen decarboxylase
MDLIKMNMNKFLKKTIEPDFAGFRECVLRKGKPHRVFFAELFLDESVRKTLIERFGIDREINRNHPCSYYLEEIALQKLLGYDMVRCCTEPVFPSTITGTNTRTSMSEDPLASGPIQNWKDFERYPWPDVAKINFYALDWLEKELPENMKCYITLPIGIYKMLLGYESMLYMMYDNPALMKAVLEKVKKIHEDFARVICSYSCVGVLWGSDDMGFNVQTFFPPDFIRENILPLHRGMAEISHEYGKLYFLHACGNLEKIMDDLIDVVGIDAKHSFEDSIMPVTEAKSRYGDRVTLIGGIDVDLLCRSDEAALRKKVRETLDTCLSGGGYCLGSGNSIADYVPLENYLIMLDEGRNWI